MAATVSALEKDLGQYVRADYEFLAQLNMVLPRLYNLGYWRDLVFEEAITTDHAYFALPRYAESVLAIMVDNDPMVTRAQWQDYRTCGFYTGGPPPIYGAVDDGFAPVIIDLANDSETYQIEVLPIAPNTTLPTEGYVIVRYTREDEEVITRTFELGGEASIITTEGADEKVVSVQEIRFDRVPDYVQVKAIADSADGTDLLLADGRGDDVARYRRFRLSNTNAASKTVYVLLKRRFEQLVSADDVVWLSDRNVIKHGLLASVAEDNADVERANYHWSVCNQLLEQEKDAHRGFVKPTLNIDFTGGAGHGIRNIL